MIHCNSFVNNYTYIYQEYDSCFTVLTMQINYVILEFSVSPDVFIQLRRKFWKKMPNLLFLGGLNIDALKLLAQMYCLDVKHLYVLFKELCFSCKFSMCSILFFSFHFLFHSSSLDVGEKKFYINSSLKAILIKDIKYKLTSFSIFMICERVMLYYLK